MFCREDAAQNQGDTLFSDLVVQKLSYLLFRKIVDSIEQMMVEAKLQRPNVKLVQGFRNVNTQNEKTEDGASTLNFGYHNLVKEVNGKIKPASRALDLIWNNAELGSYTQTNNNIEFWIRVGLLLEKERFEPILGKSFIKIEQNSFVKIEYCSHS